MLKTLLAIAAAPIALCVLGRAADALVIEEELDKCVEETPFSSDGETCRTHKIENPASNSSYSNHHVTVHWANGTTAEFDLGGGSSHTALCKATAIDVHETGPMGSPTTTIITILEGGTP